MNGLIEELAARLAHKPWSEVEAAADRLGAETAEAIQLDFPCASPARAKRIGDAIAGELRRRWREAQAARTA